MTKCDFEIILAPLQGFTDVTFRNVFSDHFSGVDEAMAPFISTMGQMRLKPSRIKDVDPANNRKLPVTPQILGNVAKDFIFLADHLFDMGHQKINWNLGCPHSKIAKKKRGSGLLMYPEEIDAFLEKVIPNISAALSVKIRLGRKSKTEIFDLLPVLDKYPLDEIIIHPRTGIQMYRGTPDHDYFEQALTQSRHTIVYNGDITDMTSFEQARNRFPGVRRFMIGRGLLSNPFLAEDIKPLNPDDPEDCRTGHGNHPAGSVLRENRMKRLQDFHSDLFEQYRGLFSGPGHLTGRMKGFWTYLALSFTGGRKYLKPILKSGSVPAYLSAVDAFFSAGLEFSP